MTIIGWAQIILYSLVLLACTKPLGGYMHKVMEGERTVLDPVLVPCETLIYKLTGVDAKHEMKWTEYAFCVLAISAASALFSYVILRCQGSLPFNPMGFSTASAPSWA